MDKNFGIGHIYVARRVHEPEPNYYVYRNESYPVVDEKTGEKKDFWGTPEICEGGYKVTYEKAIEVLRDCPVKGKVMVREDEAYYPLDYGTEKE